VSGPISGFVPRSELLDAEDDAGTLRGVVVGVDAEENLAVRVVGSFFTTTGLAYLARDWAVSNLQTVK
jgi:hypothetical protein